jgi:7-cyano-7-deazaguanine synthase
VKIRAVVLHSGGLDSTVCLLQALEQGPGVLSLAIDYGQRHRIELDYAADQCRKLGILRKVLRIEWDKPQITIPEARAISEMRGAVSPAFLPGRNVVFLTLARSSFSKLAKFGSNRCSTRVSPQPCGESVPM